MLQEQRQLHHLTLEELAKRTRIKPEYLHALEANQFDQLPAATFVKGYIRSYAQVFGFEYHPLLALLRRDYKESAKGKLIPQEFLKPVLKKSQFWTPVTMMVAVLAGVFVSLLVYVGVQWYNLNKPPDLIVFSPKSDEFVSAQVKVSGWTNPEAVVSVNTQPVALQPDGNFQTEVFLPKEGITSITVEAKDRRGKSSLQQRTVYVRF